MTEKIADKIRVFCWRLTASG